MNAASLATPLELVTMESPLDRCRSDLGGTPILRVGEVHVWRLPLRYPSWPCELLRPFLSPDEMARAERYMFDRDRAQYIAARSFLRAILARYLDCAPGEVRFEYGFHGKPYLAGSSDVSFNISHTKGAGYCAVSRARQVGVDVERIRPAVDIVGVARTAFSPDEQMRLFALPSECRVSAFYNCWTRKEAYIKARGDGMSHTLDAFDVSFEPDKPAALLRSAEGRVERDRWMMQELDAGPEYAAALVVARPIERLIVLE